MQCTKVSIQVSAILLHSQWNVQGCTASKNCGKKKQASLKDVMMGFIIYLKIAGSVFIGNYSVL